MRSLRSCLILCVVWTAWTDSGRCGENLATTTVVYPCLPAPGPITIDGRLEQTEWGHAVEAAGFTVSGSSTLVAEPVLMKLTYDEARLYLGIVCMESNMKGLKTSGAGQRDGAFWFDDSLEFFIDASHDHETYRQFAVTAKGILYDNLQGDSAWDADWQATPILGTDRWMVEIAVSLTDLSAEAPGVGALWGFNLCRERQAGGKLELCNWADVGGVFNTVARFGHLAFMPTGWVPTAGNVAQAVRQAGGKESRLFVDDGFWNTRSGAPPVRITFLEQLRLQDRGCPPFIAKLEAIHAASPTLPHRETYTKLAAEYEEIRVAITSDQPLPAAAFDRHSRRLEGLQADAENVYWHAKLAELNQAME